MSANDLEPRYGYQVTTPLRTIVDVAESALSQEHLDSAVREALEQGLVRLGLLRTVSCSAAARRRLNPALAVLREDQMAE